MGRYADFTPDGDDGLWVIKWIDGLRLAHLASRSAAIGVVLERLPDGTHLSALRANDVPRLLGRTSGTGSYVQASVLVGALPELAVGHVFQRGDCVGELPSAVQTCQLSNGEAGLEAMTLQSLRKPPQSWSPEYPYRVLHANEYALPAMEIDSHCLVVNTSADVEVVLPRAVIFKRFYATHTRLANAVTRGPFSLTRDDVICLTPLASGLRTGIDAATGAWQLILQRSMRDPFAPLLALLNFDNYARASADAIYTQALQDRGGRRWAATPLQARLPFDPRHGRVDLQLKGLWLRDRTRGAVRIKSTFLATSIVNSTFPRGLPDIHFERANSNREGDTRTVSDSPAPYRLPAPTLAEGDARLALDNANDPTLIHGQYWQSVDEFSWSHLPPMRKLEKTHSTVYQGGAGAAIDMLGPVSSVGLPSSRGQAPSSLEMETAHRPRCSRFEGLIKAMERLASQGVIDAMDIVAPVDRRQWTERGGRPAWLFLDLASRESGIWPRSGWRLLSREALVNGRRAPRCAMVLRLTKGVQSKFWIEIEGRSQTDTYYSPVLAGLPDESHSLLEEVIEIIAQHNGVDQQKVLPSLLRSLGGGDVSRYRHDLKEDDGVFKAESVRRVLGW